MRVKSVEKIKLITPVQLYDVSNIRDNSNFIINGKTKDIVAHNCGLLDEINFGAGSNIKMTQSAMMKTYRAVKMRMESRFYRDGGKLPTKLFLVSSKKSELDFLEQYIATVKNDKNVFIVDAPIWEVKPKEIYSGKKFKIAVGNKFLASIILRQDETEDDYIKQGYQIIDVPLELKSNFEKDIDGALMDIAGISTSVTMKFMSYERIKRVLCKRQNPFTKNIIRIGLDDDLQIKDFFDTKVVPESLYTKPVYIHIDTSLTGDITGLSGVCTYGAKSALPQRDNPDSLVSELFFKHLFSVGIKSPSDSEISLEKTRQFIYFLKNLGWNIKRVTIDGFQSADTRQILITKGFKSDILSLDKTPVGYTTFRATVNEERLELLDISELSKELTELEKDNFTGKIDHPPGGSKDISDSVAGAVWSASQEQDEFIFKYGEDLDVMLDIAGDITDDRTKVLRELTVMLQQDTETVKKEALSILEREKQKIGTNQALNSTHLTNEEEQELNLEVVKNAENSQAFRELGADAPVMFDDNIIIF